MIIHRQALARVSSASATPSALKSDALHFLRHLPNRSRCDSALHTSICQHSLQHSICQHLGTNPQRKSLCLVSHTLQTPLLPPGGVRHHFWPQVRWYSIAHAVNQRLRRQHSRSSLRHSDCLHLSMMVYRQAPAPSFCLTSTPPDPEIGASSFLAATSAGATSPTLSMSRHQHHGALCDTVIACIHSMVLKRQAAAGCLRCFKRPICPRNRCATISAHNVRRYSIAHAVIQRQRHQHPRCSLRHSVCLHPQHNAAAQSCCFASPKLHAPHLPPKLVRHDFCAVRPSIQHCSSGNSAAAAPAFTQLSATQRLPASKHDAAPSSSC